MRTLFTVAFLATAIGFATTANAQSKSKDPAPAAPSSSGGSDKLDLKQLEDQYWSAKDTDFTVVQNRTYAKEKKVFVSMAYGPLINDPFSNGRMSAIGAGYYWSERMGAELNYESGSLSDNRSTTEITGLGGFPNMNRFNNYVSANFLIVPFYAKMSFWDRKILYFDMQFGLGVGRMNYTNVIDSSDGGNLTGSAMGYNFDITQQFFFHEHFAIRLDIKNKWSSQKFYQNNSPGVNAKPTSLGNKGFQDTSILVGATIFF